MKDLYCRTNILIYILQFNTNINSFSLSTNVIECYHGILKNRCFSHQTTQVMRGVIKRYMIEQASKNVINSQNDFPKQRIQYCREFTGGHQYNSDEQRSASRVARIIYDAISNKQSDVIDLVHQKNNYINTLNQLNNSMNFQEIRLLCNYRYSDTTVREYCVFNLVQQGKKAKINETGKWVNQKSRKQCKK
ncbi:Hypothetical_protein [Hexamita inflata]|uniref:Hypothetical_protein n=1 Tax=Hexamita inflata TaxID=28002 RepID=A0AA86U6B6_9EUKA|nr:Hypothetical protein HINF_LOCUS30344 [Hexamita inflata]